MNAFYPLLRNALFQVDAETIHDFALFALKQAPARALLRTLLPAVHEQPVKLWDYTFRNRVGLAAGFDKNAEALHAWDAMNFGFIEVGTVTPLGQPGNNRPRIHRFPRNQALVNSMGFPNDGAEAIQPRVAKYISRRNRAGHTPMLVGINIGKAKNTPLEKAAEDYLAVLHTFHETGDFFVINISSPNTPGLRYLQNEHELRALLTPLSQENKMLQSGRGEKPFKPLLLKIAPDMTDAQAEQIAETALECGLDGMVSTNTTLDHTTLGLNAPLPGGLSGAPLQKRSTEILRVLAKTLQGKIPLIGCGGVFTADDFKAKLDAGASLVQVYTSFIYRGPGIVGELLRQS